MSDKSLLAFRGILRDCNKLRRLLKTVVTAAQEHIPIDVFIPLFFLILE